MNPIDAPIALSALQHDAYCRRKCALIHVDGVWVDNEHTIRGGREHRRVDQPGARTRRDRVVVWAVPLHSDRYNLIGRADAIEITETGAVIPVEYKAGVPYGQVAHRQLCAQALCLEEMLARPVPTGALWFSGIRRRVVVEFTDELRHATIEQIGEVRDLLRSPQLPDAVDDERCRHCQLLDHCQPALTHNPDRVDDYLRRHVWASS